MISEYPKAKVLSPETVRTKVRGLAKLSTLFFVAMRLMELVENPKTSASQLVELISTDQVLAARILKLANSAYYGFPRKISTLNLAIVVLGFNALRDLVLSISIIEILGRQKKRTGFGAVLAPCINRWAWCKAAGPVFKLPRNWRSFCSGFAA